MSERSGTAPLDLAAIRARAEAATAGPWEYENDGTYGGILVRPPIGRPHRHDSPADAAFIAAARTDVPALCDAVERLQFQLGRIGVAVEAAAPLMERQRVEIERLRAWLRELRGVVTRYPEEFDGVLTISKWVLVNDIDALLKGETP